MLIAQRHLAGDDERLLRDLLPHFRDPRYIRIGGRPLFIVYRIGVIPDIARTAERWRDLARREGPGELYLCAAKTYDTGDPTFYGFDAVVEFPPHGLRTVPMHDRLEFLDPGFAGTVVDYRQFVVDCVSSRDPSYMLHRTVMPGWDNTARRMHRALVFAHATPEVYELWLREVAERAGAKPPDERLVFINAWNEWAEGAHLEPDRRFGRQYLDATRRALGARRADGGDSDLVRALRPTDAGGDRCLSAPAKRRIRQSRRQAEVQAPPPVAVSARTSARRSSRRTTGGRNPEERPIEVIAVVAFAGDEFRAALVQRIGEALLGGARRLAAAVVLAKSLDVDALDIYRMALGQRLVLGHSLLQRRGGERRLLAFR